MLESVSEVQRLRWIRSGGAFQALGVPRFVDSAGRVVLGNDGNPLPGSVYFTSLNDTSIGRGINSDTRPPAAAPGDWGGIDFRNQIDSSVAGRRKLEAQGLFLNSIMQADVRFGGGQVVVDGVSQVITPIHMVDSRPTIANSLITRSSDAAMAATPNSFKESNFEDPATQGASPFISDFQELVHPFMATDSLPTRSTASSSRLVPGLLRRPK